VDCRLSFVSANLGSLELMGWAGSAYQYASRHTLVLDRRHSGHALPSSGDDAFYYVSKTHSVPGYLMLRFGQHARVLAAISFATEMILMSGVNMFAMAVVMKVVLGWNITFSILVSACAVTLYVALAGCARPSSRGFAVRAHLGRRAAGAYPRPDADGWMDGPEGQDHRQPSIHRPAQLPRTVMFTYGATQAILRPTRWVSLGRASSSD